MWEIKPKKSLGLVTFKVQQEVKFTQNCQTTIENLLAFTSLQPFLLLPLLILQLFPQKVTPIFIAWLFSV